MNSVVHHIWALAITFLIVCNEGCVGQPRIAQDQPTAVIQDVVSITSPATPSRHSHSLSSQRSEGRSLTQVVPSVENEMSALSNMENIQAEKQEALIENLSVQNEGLRENIVLEHESFQEILPAVHDETNAEFENLQSWEMKLPIPSSNRRKLANEPEVDSVQNDASSQVNEDVDVFPSYASNVDPESYEDESTHLHRVNKTTTQPIAHDSNEISQVPFPGFEAIAIPVFSNEYGVEDELDAGSGMALEVARDAESNGVSLPEDESDGLLTTQKEVSFVFGHRKSTGLGDEPSEEIGLSLPALVLLPPLPKVSLETLSDIFRGPERNMTSFSDSGKTKVAIAAMPTKLQKPSYPSVPKEASSRAEEGRQNSRKSDVLPTQKRRIENDKPEELPVIQSAVVSEHAVNEQPSEDELRKGSQAILTMIQETEEKPQPLQGASRSIDGLNVCQQGREQLARHQYQEAMVSFSESIRAFQARKVRDDAAYELRDCYRQRAYAYFQLKAPAQALSDITHVLRRVQPGDSDRSQDVFFRGRLHANMHDFQNAIDDLSQALELGLQAEDQAYAYYLRGLSHLRLQHIDLGLRDVSEGCRQNFSDACQLLEQIL